ncbi:hypothetical protein FB45DRAFT_920302 [Roridomyces roridus]|uniref:Uncharacterized protein n=1 Tax=Roridomyces roridus TaxID=1738132 RepID=A0AAD7BPP2_9AGAR|nr:hypothetical protein FB45DRAFT_920302 [Roridomyces roridus]
MSTPDPSNVLRVHLAPGFPHADALFPENFADYAYTESSLDAADVVLKTDGADTLVVERRSELMHLDGVYDFKLPIQGNWHQLPLIVGHIAHFHFFLERMAGSGSGLTESVQLKMFRVTGERPDRVADAAYPDFLNNTNSEGGMGIPVARIPPQADIKYGFEIHNTGTTEIYAYLFYFDPETYHIFPMHNPHRANRPLTVNGGVQQIGLGEDPAYEFTPEDDKQSNSAFLKLFVSTERLNLDWIQCEGLLETGGGVPPGVRPQRTQRKVEMEVRGWDTLTAVVTMTTSG